MIHRVTFEHIYHVECWLGGVLLWSDTFANLVTNAGKAKYLDATLKTGLAAPAWFVGIVTSPGTYLATDTMAAHAGWAEATAYLSATRPAWTPGAVTTGAPSSVDSVAAPAQFDFTAAGTIAGCFLVDSSTKGGATGTLLGVGDFSGGPRPVEISAKINVSITAQAA